MRSTFYGLEVARSGLYTAQNELNITGHNIANVDTEGYTRQRLATAAIPAQSMNVQIAVDQKTTAGRGVTGQYIEQIRDAFVDMRYREESSVTGYYETFSEEFYMVELLFNNALEKDTSSTSINAALASFYSSLNAMAAETSNSKDIREHVLQSAINLSDTINYAYTKLEEQASNINEAVRVTVDEINDIGEAIANLNRQIFGYELTGARANDLRDQRNLLLDELSEKVNIEYYENAKGHLVVSVGGRKLVDGVENNRLTVDPNGAVNKMDVDAGVDPPGYVYTVVWEDLLGNPGTRAEDKVTVQSGELKAYLDLRDGDTTEVMGIPYIAEQLNELARKIASEVNEVHRQGYTMPYTETDALGAATPSLHSMVQDADGNWVAQTLPDGTYMWEGNVQPVTDPITGTVYYASTRGVDFFFAGTNGDYQTVSAKSLRVSDEIKNNVCLIASSSVQMTVPDTGYPQSNQFYGDTQNISNIMKLYDKEDTLGKPDNFENFLNGIVTTVAERQSHLNSMDTAQQVRIESIVSQRKSISSVSLDDEMTNVIRFQHAYNASARIITAIDEELDTIINRMGLVGR